jgi:hypothetical protein
MELPITTAQMMKSRARPRYYRNLCAHLADIAYELMKKKCAEIANLKVNIASNFQIRILKNTPHDAELL